MKRIVYISTCRNDPDRAMVDEILASSRRNNARDGLTGLLVVGGRRFLQVLEGPDKALDVAYERIKADPRHFALVSLSSKRVESRAFTDWDMGCEQLNGDDLSAVVDRLTDGLNDPDLRAQFRSFVAMHRNAA